MSEQIREDGFLLSLLGCYTGYIYTLKPGPCTSELNLKSVYLQVFGLAQLRDVRVAQILLYNSLSVYNSLVHDPTHKSIY